MAIVAIVTATGSPGASTAALACALTWSGRNVTAECDPAGGVILPGYLANLSIPSGHGLLALAKADLRDQLQDAFWSQLIDLDPPGQMRLVLPGLADAAQAPTLDRLWPRLASLLAGLEFAAGYDVIADCGRVSAAHFAWPLVTRADVVLLAVRPTNLRSIAPAASAVALLRRRLVEATATDLGLGLMTIGDQGDYRYEDVARQLAVPIIAQLPEDQRTARALGGAGPVHRSRELLRHAASAGERIQAEIAGRRAHINNTGAVGARSGR